MSRRRRKKAYKILKACNKKIIGWSDNNKSLYNSDKQIFDGLPGILPGELGVDYADKTVIITVKNALPIYQQLVMMGFPREHIIISKNGFLIGFQGEQYFDLFDADRNSKEVSIDAGCWDGSTSKDFVRWCGGDNYYDYIYAFEPDESDIILVCTNKYEDEVISFLKANGVVDQKIRKITKENWCNKGGET